MCHVLVDLWFLAPRTGPSEFSHHKLPWLRETNLCWMRNDSGIPQRRAETWFWKRCKFLLLSAQQFPMKHKNDWSIFCVREMGPTPTGQCWNLVTELGGDKFFLDGFDRVCSGLNNTNEDRINWTKTRFPYISILERPCWILKSKDAWINVRDTHSGKPSSTPNLRTLRVVHSGKICPTPTRSIA